MIKKRKWNKIFSVRNISLYLMLILPLLQVFFFRYRPMVGTVVAFKEYNKFRGIWESPWAGFEHFRTAFRTTQFSTALKNTLILNVGDLLLSFPLPIILAILLFEVRSKKLRNTTQIITYLPNFLSWVIISGIVVQVFSAKGLMNTFLNGIGLGSVNFLTNPKTWRIVYWVAGIWAGTGYSLIIYMAALAGVDTSLYEAAYLDGAGRWKRIWHVTLPQIRPTITVLLIMALGKIINISFDRPFMMKNALVSETAEVISTFVYQVGLRAGRYDYAAAIGLFQSVVGVILLFTVNAIIKKLGEESIL